MPLTVFKYPIDAGAQEILMPKDAKLLSVVAEPRPLSGDQGGIFLYALVDPSPAAPTEIRGFTMTGTGLLVEVPEGRELGPFVGTANASPYYFHVFEVLL